jgi:glycosyltransferase involved in cell wall biosynthesis
MPRIIYLLLSNGGLTGGQKMILRHVETLYQLGFDAAVMLGEGSKAPTGVQHAAPLLEPGPLWAGDVIVIPDDAAHALRLTIGRPERAVVFAQGGYSLPAHGADVLDTHPADRFPPFITVGDLTAARIRRLYPQARVEVIPCFADERVFRPLPDKRLVVALTPDKRAFETAAIRGLFRRLHKRHADLRWITLRGADEGQVSGVLGRSALYLSLNRLESVGMTTLEAMACGCIGAGFLGGGGRQYGTDENGFWVDDEDCEAAADALASAADLAAAGGPALARMQEAARVTAERWSYARFKARLEEVWMRLAPEARLNHQPVSSEEI